MIMQQLKGFYIQFLREPLWSKALIDPDYTTTFKLYLAVQPFQSRATTKASLN